MNATEIHIRRILEQAISNRASAIVIAHNHPNGFALPSVEDQISTKRITDTMNIVGVTLVDHLVFAEGDYVSMRSTPTLRHLFRPSSIHNGGIEDETARLKVADKTNKRGKDGK